MLIIENISKTYREGKKEALKNVSFKVQKGEFIALLGHNGAGKSTLINVISGNVKKNSGKVIIEGIDLDKNEILTKKIVGVVPQEISIEFNFTVGEMLNQQSGYFGIKNNQEYIDELLKKLALTEKRKVLARNLSGGMKRRLMIAKALVHKPKLLILDEPTAGVDIELRHSMYKFLNQLHSSGTTIILTTHYLEEAEKLCDRILIIKDGLLVADEKKDKLIAMSSKKSSVEFHFEEEIKIDDFSYLNEYSPKIKESNILLLNAEKNRLNNIFSKIIDNNVRYSNFKINEPNLEDIFIELTKNGEYLEV